MTSQEKFMFRNLERRGIGIERVRAGDGANPRRHLTAGAARAVRQGVEKPPASPDISPIRGFSLALCPHNEFSSLGNTHGYSAQSENPLYGQMPARDSRESVRYPG